MASNGELIAGVERAAPGEVRVRRALLSVSDKGGIVDFARGLVDLGVELVSTGGTARALAEAGIEVRAIEDFTGFPEIMDGRVKTLHPRLYAGLLARRDSEEHLRAAAEQAIEQVDLVCVNLYPFEQTVRAGAAEEEAIENIDIGGPTSCARGRAGWRSRRAGAWRHVRSRSPPATTRRSPTGSRC